MKKITTTIWFNNDFVNLARMVDAAGTLINQAGIASIQLEVYDLDAADPSASVYSEAVNVGATVFDALQTDGRWAGIDASGYNFRHLVGNTRLPVADHHYRCVYEFTASDGTKYPAVFEVLATNPVPS